MQQTFWMDSDSEKIRVLVFLRCVDTDVRVLRTRQTY